MAFVKLDTGILNSTLWFERDCREIFITALLMAHPLELREPMPQLHVSRIEPSGFVVPIGWYGFVPAAGPGIIRMAMCSTDSGMVALARLGSPDPESRTPDHEGRRMARVDGGYIILNFMKYRDKDNTTKERSARYRERQKLMAPRRDDVSSRRDSPVFVTENHQAEEEAEEETKIKTKTARKRAAPSALVSLPDLIAEGIDQQLANDWLTIRKARGLPLTATAWDGIKAEAVKAGLSTADAIKRAAQNSWGGFKASWPDPGDARPGSTTASSGGIDRPYV